MAQCVRPVISNGLVQLVHRSLDCGFIRGSCSLKMLGSSESEILRHTPEDLPIITPHRLRPGPDRCWLALRRCRIEERSRLKDGGPC